MNFRLPLFLLCGKAEKNTLLYIFTAKFAVWPLKFQTDEAIETVARE